MPSDKYTAVWVSYSSMSDFLKCPRLYFLKNIYRSPSTGHKIKYMTPPLALGQIIHEVIDSLSYLPKERRFLESLRVRFDDAWQKVRGKKGGFVSEESEFAYKKRGEQMVEKIMKNPGPLQNLAVKMKTDLPNFWLSEKDNIILCGKIDWMEFLPGTKSVHIIDFKTSRGEEGGDSLQLPIYFLLASCSQKYPVTKMSYWYLERNVLPQRQPLPDLKESQEKILDIAKKIKVARKLEILKCSHNEGCPMCTPFERIVKGEAEFVGTNGYNDDMYILEKSGTSTEEEAVIF